MQDKNRRNFLLLMLLSVFLLFISYRVAICKTLTEWKELQKNKKQIILLQDAPAKIKTLDAGLKRIELQLNKMDGLKENPQEILLGFSKRLKDCPNIFISEFPGMILSEKNGLSLTYQAVIFQGPFNELVKLLSALEKDKRPGNIISVAFYNQIDGKTRFKALKMKVIFQSIKPRS